MPIQGELAALNGERLRVGGYGRPHRDDRGNHHLDRTRRHHSGLAEPPEEKLMAALIATRNTGMLLLAIWLILSGLAGLVALPLPSVLMAVLALLAGIFILLGR